MIIWDFPHAACVSLPRKHENGEYYYASCAQIPSVTTIVRNILEPSFTNINIPEITREYLPYSLPINLSVNWFLPEGFFLLYVLSYFYKYYWRDFESAGIFQTPKYFCDNMDLVAIILLTILVIL